MHVPPVPETTYIYILLKCCCLKLENQHFPNKKNHSHPICHWRIIFKLNKNFHPALWFEAHLCHIWRHHTYLLMMTVAWIQGATSGTASQSRANPSGSTMIPSGPPNDEKRTKPGQHSALHAETPDQRQCMASQQFRTKQYSQDTIFPTSNLT